MTCTHNPTPSDVIEYVIANEFFWGLAREIHGQNVTAGWWTDHKTGESTSETRNRGEIMMLIVSELAEASDGHNHDMRDDKLPEYPMFDVELADTAIRLFDLLGVEEPKNPTSGFSLDRLVRARRELLVLDDKDRQLMLCVRFVAMAMEHHRKGRIERYVELLWRVQEHIFGLAELHAIPIMAVINAKRAFNAVREDHKIENRTKEGGKAY